MKVKKLLLSVAIFASFVGTALAGHAYYVTSCGRVFGSISRADFHDEKAWTSFCQDMNKYYCGHKSLGHFQFAYQDYLKGVHLLDGSDVYYLF